MKHKSDHVTLSPSKTFHWFQNEILQSLTWVDPCLSCIHVSSWLPSRHTEVLSLPAKFVLVWGICISSSCVCGAVCLVLPWMVPSYSSGPNNPHPWSVSRISLHINLYISHYPLIFYSIYHYLQLSSFLKNVFTLNYLYLFPKYKIFVDKTLILPEQHLMHRSTSQMINIFICNNTRAHNLFTWNHGGRYLFSWDFLWVSSQILGFLCLPGTGWARVGVGRQTCWTRVKR